MPSTASPNSDATPDVETQPLCNEPGTVKTGPHFTSELHFTSEKIAWLFAWMVISSIVVIYNKWVFTTGGFPYPLALTTMHMTSCFVIFGAIRKLAPDQLRLAIMPDADVETPWPVYVKNFLSISVFYAGTLGAGNMAYLFSSVAFIQMMKPMNCIFASIAAFVIGVEVPTSSHMIIVSVIAFGVIFATQHAVVISTTGCLLQMVSSLSEGCRLALVQAATNGGLKLDPVTTVYHFSGASAVLLSFATLAHERHLDLSTLHSPWVLVVSCAMAVILNVLVAAVIKKTSAVVFALSGVMKDVLVIGASTFIFRTPISRMTMAGYSISVGGLFMFKAYKDNFAIFKEYGFIAGMTYATQMATKRLL